MIRIIRVKCLLYGEALIVDDAEFVNARKHSQVFTFIPVDVKAVFRYG